MSIGLQPTAGAPAAALRAEADAAPSGRLAPEERVTLTAQARRASRALPQPPSSTVRWYRAPRLVRPVAPAPEPPRARLVHAAVAAYRRQVSAAA
jgi:hypothetical protein